MAHSTQQSRHVAVFVADRCHLCEVALEVIEPLCSELGFELEIVRIDGDDELERRYRLDIPVVEIDGERAFVYEVTAEGLRAALG